MKLRNFAYGAAVVLASALIIVGTAGTSEAAGKKGKKAAAPPPPPPVICTTDYKPVCGVRQNLRFTYSNACFAQKDGAKVVGQGACKPAKAAKKAAKKPAAKKK